MVRSDIRSYFSVAKQQICKEPASWLAFAALLAWMFGLYWSDLFVARSSTVQFDFLQLRALWLAVEALTLLVAYRGVRFVSGRPFLVAAVAGTCLFAGTVLVLFAPAGVSFDVFRIGGTVLTGIGGAALLALQGIGFARKGPKVLLVNVALALTVASAFDSALLYLPSALQPMVVCLLPIVCVAFLAMTRRAAPIVSEKASDERSAGQGRAMAIRIVALPLVVGLAYGLMQRLTGDAYTSGVAEVNIATIVSFFLSAVFIALAALLFDSRKLIKLVCFVAIPIIGIAFVMLPLFSDAAEAAQAICIVGFNSFYFMVWALWAGDRKSTALPKRFILGLFVLVGAESLGSLIGIRVVAAVQESGSTLAVVSLVVVYLLLMAGILSFDRAGGGVFESPRGANDDPAVEGDAFVSVEAEGRETLPLGQGRESFSIADWAERYQLSARETEVFELLAKGRNRVYISKELFISDNTTRTHMKNVYRKLGVHSQQELIDMIEGKLHSDDL